MWPFKRTLSERYSKLVNLIKSIDSHFQMTENKEDSLRLHLPNYKGNQPMDFHIYLMEPFLFISFVTEIKGERISVLNSYHQSIDPQDMFNMAMSSNLERVHQVLENKLKKEEQTEEIQTVGTSSSYNSDQEQQEDGIPVGFAIEDLKETFDYNESFKKHALTFLILRPKSEFWYYSKQDDEKPLWIYNDKEEKNDLFLMEDRYVTGTFPFLWYLKKYEDKEELCWFFDFLNKHNMDLWTQEYAESTVNPDRPEEIIKEMKRYVPSLNIRNNPQNIKVNLGWSWIDIQSMIRFIDYCMNSLDWTVKPGGGVKSIRDCSTLCDLAYLVMKDMGYEYNNSNQKEKDNEPTIIESWSLLEFAKENGKMKVTAPMTYVNTKTGEKFVRRACAFIHPTKKDEKGKPLFIFVNFSSHLGELTPQEISDRKDELVVVKYENGTYALDCRQISNETEVEVTTKVADEDFTNNNKDLNDFLYERIKQCAYELLLSLKDANQKDLDRKLLLAELTILSAASVLDIKKQKNDNWLDYVEHKILNEFLSLKEVSDYDYWIADNTPGMYIDSLYTIDDGISLEEFEKINGQVKFFRGKINAYPYDDRLWGEFVDKNGKIRIVYVNQGFPSEYDISELLNDKQAFGIFEEKEKDYHGDDIIYCLKKLKKRHRMLPSYISERLSFYQEAIEFATSNRQNIDATFQLYNAAINQMLDYNKPFLPIGYLEIFDEAIRNGQTGEYYKYNATSLKNFSMCIWECIGDLRQEFNKIEHDNNWGMKDKQSIETYSVRADVTADDLEKVWTDEYGVKYSADKKRLIYVPEGITDYSILDGTEEIGDYAFVNIECEDVDYYYIMENNLNIEDFEKNTSELVSVTIPNSVTVIGKGVFDWCTKLAVISIPEGATEKFKKMLPDYEDIFIEGDISTVAHLEHIEEIWTDDNGVKYTIDKRKLLKVPTNLTKCIILPGTIIICDGAFFECNNLNNIHLPESIRIIGKYAFYGCDSLTEINLPKSILMIGEHSFDECRMLESLYIPKNGYSQFAGMLPSLYNKIKVSPLNSVIDEDGVVYDNDYQILHFNTLPLDTYTVKYGVKVIDDYAFKPAEWKKDDGKSLKRLVLPDSIVIIGVGAFCYNESLEYINIPRSVAFQSEENPFAGCFNLHTIKWETHNTVKEGTLIYNRDKTVLVACIPWHYIDGVQKSWTLQSFVKQFGKMQVRNFVDLQTGEEFKSCVFTKLDGTHTFVEFSSTVDSIPSHKISEMNNELQVVLLESGNYSLFKGKTIIEQESIVELPDGIGTIAANAFYHNEVLKEIKMPKTITEIGKNAFEGCISLRSICIPLGTREKFEKMLPNLKYIMHEVDDTPF